MNKKGFTLIELIAVITIIALLAVIIVPTINSSISNSKQAAYETQISQIEDAAKKYMINNSELLPNSGNTTKININTLVKEGFLSKKDNKIINPINNNEMNGCIHINYSEEYNQYIYEYKETC